MADIDILLELRGLRQSTEGLNKFQATALRAREQIAQAGAVVSSFDGAMDQMNRTGTVSISTIASLASAIPSLVNPVTAVAAAVGILIQQFIRWREEQKKLQKESADRSLEVIRTEMERNLTILEATIGQTGELARAHGELAQQEFRLKEAIRLTNEQMKLNNERVGEGGFTAQHAANANVRLANNLLRAYQTMRTGIEVSKENIRSMEEAIQRAKERAEAERALEESIQARTNALGTSNFRELQLAQAMGASHLEQLTLARKHEISELTLELELRGEIDQQRLDSLQTIDLEIEKLTILGETWSALGQMGQQAIQGTAAGAFNALVDAIDDTISIQNLLSEATGRALRNSLAQVLRAIGIEATVRAAFETAAGIADAAALKPTAAAHFAAAAKYAAVAVTAGAASAGLSVSSGGGGGTGAGGGGFSGGFGGGGGSRAAGGEVIQQIILIGQLDTQAAEELNDQLVKARKTRDLGA